MYSLDAIGVNSYDIQLTCTRYFGIRRNFRLTGVWKEKDVLTFIIFVLVENKTESIKIFNC